MPITDLRNIVPENEIDAMIARDAEVTAAINAHTATTDPHTQYLLQSEGDARYRQSSVALTDSDIPATIARDSEVTAAVNAHLAATDPHTQYLLQSEGDARYRVSALKEKIITGTVRASGGGDTGVAHGLIGSNIVDIGCLVADTVRGWKIPPGFVNTTHDYFCYTTSTHFVIFIPGSGQNSGSIFGQPFEVVITYK